MFLVEKTKNSEMLISQIGSKIQMAKKNEQLALATKSIVEKKFFLAEANMFWAQRHELFKLLNPEVTLCRIPLFCDHIKARRKN